MPGSAKSPHRILRVVIIIVALLIAAVVALPFLVDANQFRPQLQSKLSDALGRDVRVGTLKLSLLSGSVTVEEIAIADNPEFSQSPFLSAKSLQVSIELKPLIFSKSIRIKGITIDKPDISLLRSESGSWNFSDLGSKKNAANTTAPAEETGTVSPQDISIGHVKIVGGQVTINKGGGRKPSVYKDVNITATNLSFTNAFPFSLTASLPGEGSLKLSGNAGPLNNNDMLMTPLSAELAVEGFDLIASGFIEPGSGLAGLVNFSGNVESDGRTVRSKGRAAADKLQVVKSGSPAQSRVSLEYAADYDLTRRNGTLSDVRIEYGKAIAKLEGDFDAGGESLVLRMKLNGKEMPIQDLAALLPAFGVILPRGASLQGGSLDTDLIAEGPIEKMVMTGTAEVFKTRLVGFDLAGKLAAVAALAGIRSSREAEVERFYSAVRMTPEGTQVNDLILVIPTLGDLSGQGTVANDQSLDFKMKAILKPGGVLGSGLARLVKGGALDVPFSVRGTASDPKFVPDVKKGAGGLLDSVIGKDSKDEQRKPSAIGDALRNLLQTK